MTRQVRRTIALTLSLLLAIFTICQAHAMATMAVSDQSASSVVTQPADSMSKQPMAADCHAECQHQQSADLSKKLQLPDTPVLLALAQSYPTSHDASPPRVVGGAAERAQGDPPPRLRFQRFLE